jgi:aubergine-like protein
MATYYSEVEIRNETDTQLPTLSKIIKSALNAYFKKNNELVEEVIIYRQGVGEGQVMQSLQHEIKAVQSGFESFKKGYKPRFAFF